jgi:hypothetical protein
LKPVRASRSDGESSDATTYPPRSALSAACTQRTWCAASRKA